MIVLLRHGLANRLRTIAGFWYVAEQLKKPIIFHWDTKNDECNGAWEDIFAPLDIIKSRPADKDIKYTFIGQNTIDRIILQYFPEKKAFMYNSKFVKQIEDDYYSRMAIKPEILNRAAEIAPPGEYAAVHIRRTDHVENAKKAGKYTTFQEFDDFIKMHDIVYLATDSRDVQKKYPNLIRNIEIPKENTGRLRQTSIQDAMVDVLICSREKKFKGSGYSSFSHLIEIYSRQQILYESSG